MEEVTLTAPTPSISTVIWRCLERMEVCCPVAPSLLHSPSHVTALTSTFQVTCPGY